MSDKNNNGNVRWWHLITASLTIIGMVITITIFITSIYIRVFAAQSAKIELNANYFHSIDKRLGRIEDKLGIASNKESANYLR